MILEWRHFANNKNIKITNNFYLNKSSGCGGLFKELRDASPPPEWIFQKGAGNLFLSEAQ